MKIIPIAIAALLVQMGSAVSQEACVDPLARVSGVVYLQPLKLGPSRTPVLANENGTAWLLKPRLLVTNEHVAESLGLSMRWKNIIVGTATREGTPEKLFVRSARLISPPKHYGDESKDAPWIEDVARVEIGRPIPNAKALKLATKLPESGDHVSVAGYPGELRVAQGRMLRYADPEVQNASRGMLLINLNRTSDGQTPMKNGSSGGPFFNCEGDVVAMIAVAYDDWEIFNVGPKWRRGRIRVWNPIRPDEPTHPSVPMFGITDRR